RDLPPRPSAARAVTPGGCGRPRPRRTPMSITLVRLRRSLDRVLYDEEGASTAEYAITVLAAMNELGHTQPAVPLARPCRGQRRRTPGDSVALTYEATRSQGGVPAPLSRPVRTRGEAWIGTRRSGSESASESTWTCPAHDSPMTRRCSWLTWWTTTRTTGAERDADQQLRRLELRRQVQPRGDRQAKGHGRRRYSGGVVIPGRMRA